MGWTKWIDSDAPASTSTTSDCSQSVPSSPANTRCPSRFDVPDTLESQVIPRAKTPTGDAPSNPTVSTAVSMCPPRKSPSAVIHHAHPEMNCHPRPFSYRRHPPERSRLPVRHPSLGDPSPSPLKQRPNHRPLLVPRRESA
jgi:hypothetical protein